MKKYMFLLLAGVLILGGIGSAMAYDLKLASGIWSGNGKEYLVLQYGDPNNWDDAKIDASKIPGGYQLATITSQGENDFIVNLIKGINTVDLSWRAFYLGGYQNPLDTQVANANWTWVTGEPWGFVGWASGEPNDYSGPGSEQYLGLYQPLDWGWIDMLSLNYDWGRMGYIAESINPVPEPATMLLLGSGLIGLAGYGRKKFFKK
jgi:hypothetical protein